MDSLKLFAVLLSFFLASCSYQREFDREVWLKNPKLRDDGEYPRNRMIEDLTQHYLKVGMARSSVLNLLGPPSDEGVRYFLPDGMKEPDSLSFGNHTIEEMNVIMEKSNKFYAKYQQPDTIIAYIVGSSAFDTKALHIRLSGKGRANKFWVSKYWGKD